MNDIITQHKSSLYDNLKKSSESFSFQDLNDHALWDFCNNNSFHQFLQGFILITFSSLIHDIVKTQQCTNAIVKSLHMSIIKSVFSRIWLERCKDMQLFEQHHSIDNATKRRPSTSTRKAPTNPTLPVQEEDDNLNDLHMTWIQQSIWFGNSWMDFLFSLN